MNDRSALGLADVDDEQFVAMVAEQLGVPAGDVRELSTDVHVVPYDLPAITTAARFWVRGEATTTAGVRPFSFFVKHVQSWGRSPMFAEVPLELREFAESNVPWQTEPLVYRSDLATRLPAGLSTARCHGVYDLDEKAAAIWLEELRPCERAWDLDRYERAAGLLGRLAGSATVAAVRIGGPLLTVRHYYEGRLTHQVLPLLHSDIWQHPVLAATFDADLRRRLLAAADRLPAMVDEVSALPHGPAHGDACPNNLLVVDGRAGFVLIDFAFFQFLPIGFDLGQLVVGDVQVGRRRAAELAPTHDRAVPAFVDGLRAEGCAVSEATVRRANALCFLIFTGLSSLPFEHLAADPPDLADIAAERAAIARFALELEETTRS